MAPSNRFSFFPIILYIGGSIVWRRDLGPSDAFSSIQTDPTDRRRVALTTAAGAFATLRLDSPSSDRVRYQRFQAEITAGTLQCSFPGVRELLLLLLHRELIVFDVEYGQPAASTPLPGSMPAFDTIIGSYGHAVASVGADEPGIDAIYCAHVDGSVSLWQRVENSLKYTLAGHFPMLSSQSWMGRSGGGGGGSSGGAHGNSSTTGVNKILSWVSAPWTASASGTAELQGASQATAIGAMERQQGAPHPGRVLQLNPAGQDGSSGTLATSNNKKIQAQKGNALLLMALATDGSWWKWELPLLQGTLPAASSNKPSGAQDTSPAQTLPPPRLLGALHSLSHRITAFSAYPGLIGLSNSPHCAAAGVAGTASGSLELVTIQQGRLTALHSAVSASLDAHSGPVKGVRWLGRSPRAVSFSSERNPAGEYMNSLLVTDFRSGGSIAFREGSGEAAPLTGVRASAAGAYVLLIFRGLPSEVWAVPEGALPYRLRQIDLQFTSVEFLPEDFGTLPAAATDVDVVFWGAGATSSSAGDRALASSSTGTGASAATPSGNMSGGGGAPGGARASSPRSAEDLPEERLVFTLADGRMGILSVKGRKIQDTKPRMPTWTRLATGGEANNLHSNCFWSLRAFFLPEGFSSFMGWRFCGYMHCWYSQVA